MEALQTLVSTLCVCVSYGNGRVESVFTYEPIKVHHAPICLVPRSLHSKSRLRALHLHCETPHGRHGWQEYESSGGMSGKELGREKVTGKTYPFAKVSILTHAL